MLAVSYVAHYSSLSRRRSKVCPLQERVTSLSIKRDSVQPRSQGFSLAGGRGAPRTLKGKALGTRLDSVHTNCILKHSRRIQK